jgi:hypothetical protein
MGDAKTPGDGKTNPFGGPGAGTMAGNDFNKNPGGSGAGGKGIDLLTKPNGSGPSGAKPRDFTKSDNTTQKSGEAADLNPGSEIRQDGSLVPLADVPSGSPRAPMIGVGSIGNSKKPFKVSGG